MEVREAGIGRRGSGGSSGGRWREPPCRGKGNVEFFETAVAVQEQLVVS